MSAKISNETKTGVMVFICLAALAALIIKVGNFTWLHKGYLIKAQFHYTEGVKPNAPVRLSGVDVGEVKAVRLIYGDEVLVEADLWLEESVKVRKNAKAYVTMLGMMGEKYIEIRPGSSDVGYAQPGDLIESKDPVRLEDLIEIGTRVAEDIGTMAKDISRVANHVDEAVVDNRRKLDRIFDNLEETSENFAEFSQDVKHHPWKVLMKGKEKPKEELKAERAAKQQERQKAKQNFTSKNA